MKLVLISDPINGEEQERSFRAKYVGEAVVVVKTYDELEKAIKDPKNDLNNEVYLGGVSTPMNVDTARAIIAKGQKAA